MINRALLAVSIFLVMAYAWLAAQLLEPHREPPAAAVARVSWLVKGEEKPWDEFQARHLNPLAVESVWRSFENVARSLPLIGSFAHAPRLVIDTDHEGRYVIGDDKVVISQNIALADGQLVKALLKVWLLQRAAPGLTASLLRFEVLSDVLAAMVTDNLRFELPGYARSVRIPRVRNWLVFAKSYVDQCSSPWRSFELQGACGESHEMSPLSFRPLLDAMLLQVYDQQSVFARADFLRSWSRALTVASPSKGSTLDLERASRRLVDWRDDLIGEIQLLLADQGTNLQREAILEQSQLLKPIAVSAVMHSQQPESEGEFIHGSLPGRTREAFVASLGGEAWLVTPQWCGQAGSWVHLDPSDLTTLSSPLLVVESCQKTMVSELLRLPSESKRILYVKSCGGHRMARWKALLNDGVKGFATLEPESPFLLLQRGELVRAVAHNQLGATDLLESYMSKSVASERSLLGLNTAEWHREMLAYKVLGAIEAIEWFREPKQTKSL